MQSRWPVVLICLTLVIDAIGIGLILPVMPFLLEEIQGATLSDAALWGGLLSFIYAFMQFLSGPLIGNLSDAFGRRPVLICCLAALGINYILMALAPTLLLLVVARIVSGVAGSSFSAASAYLADISPPEKRAANFGLIGASFGVGFVIGPLIGGVLGEFGPRAPFWAAGALALANAAFALFLLPESLARDKRRRFELRRANPVMALADLRRAPVLGGLVGVVFLMSIASWVYPAVWSFYTIYVFGFSAWQVGLSLTVYGIALALVQGVLIRPVLKWLGEARTAVVGILLVALGMAGLTLVGDPVVLFLIIPLLALGEVADPALTGVLSNRVGDDVQGELQGILASVGGIATMISPLVFTAIFAAFTAEETGLILPGAPFLLAAALAGLALLLLLHALRAQPAPVNKD